MCLNQGDVEYMKQIGLKYSKSLWKRGVVDLTFGNMLMQLLGAGEYVKKFRA